jgi:hypothetical protein
MKKFGKWIARLIAILTMALVLVGCGKDEGWKKWTTEQLAIDKNGQVIYCVVDSFEKNFYDLDELTGMAVKEVASFNGENKEGENAPATVLEVARLEEDENAVRVTYQFDKGSTCGSFLDTKLYYETVEETFEQKHVFTGTVLYDKGGSITLDEPNKVKLRTKHVLVTDFKGVMHLPEDVMYYTNGVKLLSDGIDTTGCEDTVIVILKK